MIMPEPHLDEVKNTLGRMLMVGFHGPEPDRHLGRMIDDCGVGGVILFRRNIEDRDQLRKLTGEIQEIFDVSRNTAYRYLEELEKEGKISQIKKFGRDVHYRLLK